LVEEVIEMAKKYSDRQIELRRQEAWAIARQCEQVLRDQFGVTQVIIFGSLAGQSPWHWNSGALLLDLDEYRKFRHVVHHKYGDGLQADYVIRLAEMAPAMVENIRQAIARFDAWLTQQASE